MNTADSKRCNKKRSSTRLKKGPKTNNFFAICYLIKVARCTALLVKNSIGVDGRSVPQASLVDMGEFFSSSLSLIILAGVVLRTYGQ